MGRYGSGQNIRCCVHFSMQVGISLEVSQLLNSYYMIKEAFGLDPGPTFSLQTYHHREATSFGWPLHPSKCKCSDRVHKRQILDLFFGSHKLFYLGPQIPSYLLLLELGMYLILVASLAMGVPLAIVSDGNGWCQNNSQCSEWFVVGLSIFNSWDNQSTVDLMFYLTAPVTALSFLVLFYGKKRLADLRNKYQGTGYYPDSHACLLKLPFNHLSQSYITAQLDSWWQQQISTQQEDLALLCPQLLSSLPLSSSTERSQEGPQQKQLASRFVDKIVLSFNYQAFRQLQQELKTFGDKMQGQPDRQELNQLMELHKKKKGMAQHMAKNKYCVVVFKRASYCSYLYHRNNPQLLQKMLSCCQPQQAFTIDGEKVKVWRDNLPEDIYWSNMHLGWLERGKLWGIAGLVIGVIVSGGLWVAGAFTYKKLNEDGSAVVTYLPYIGGSIAFMWMWIYEQINEWASRRQNTITRSQQTSSMVFRGVFINLCTFLLFPFLFFDIFQASLIWGKRGLVETLFIQLIIFNLVNLLSPYLGWRALKNYYHLLTIDKSKSLQQMEANQQLSKPHMPYNSHLTHLITNIFFAFFLMPISAIMGAQCLLWIVLSMFLSRFNIGNIWREGKGHGLAATQLLSFLIELAPLLTVGSSFAMALLASQYSQYTFSIAPTVVACVMALLVVLFIMVPSWKIPEVSSAKTYSDLQPKYIQVYQQTNEPYEFMADKTRVQSEEVRLKVEEQMNAMSKTLTMSLKEQLQGRQATVLENIEQLSEAEEGHTNNMYFEYEQKVFMKPRENKILVPPLFKKKQTEASSVQKKQEDSGSSQKRGKVGLGKLFGRHEKEAFNHVKKKIRQQVKDSQSRH